MGVKKLSVTENFQNYSLIKCGGEHNTSSTDVLDNNDELPITERVRGGKFKGN